MATIDGAAALGLRDVGKLVAGYRADLIHLDVAPMYPVVDEADLLTHLVYSGSPSLIRDVWVEGSQVVRSGEVTSIDMAELRRQASMRARRLAER
jgi:5-methylthioadenosine/S-adenosylhomocysteine deaminase